jgi:glycosyltransferase involved in cell wall biosynthesis
VAPLADTPRNTGQGCCPIKMVESMAAGTPVLASDLAVCREWIEHGREGWLAPAGDTRAWALAIHRMFTDGELIRRLSHSARAAAERHFSWSSVHSRLDGLFQQAAAPGGS